MPRLLRFLLLVLPALAGGSALGQPAGTRAAAERAFAEGAENYRRADYEKAIEAFTRSYGLHRHHLTLCNLARCHEHAGRLVQAASFYGRCLQEGGGASPKAEAIRSALRAVQSRLSRLAIRASTGEATAYVDDQAAGATPAQVTVEPGRHSVYLRRGATRSETVSIELRAGELRTILLQLRERAPQAAVSLPAPKTPRASPPSRRIHRAWFWTTVAVTVACGVTSAIMGASAMSANRAYEAGPTKEGFDRVILRRDLTNAFFGLSLGGVAASGVLFYFTRFRVAVDASDDTGFDVALLAGGRF